MDEDRDRIARATGRMPVVLVPASGHGAPSNRRWIATFADGSTVFAKIAAYDYVAGWLRTELANYEALTGARFLPRLLGWDDDGSEPCLVLEDLSDGVWPPPWSTRQIEAVLGTLELLQATPAPPTIPAMFGEMFDIREGWDAVRADPASALSLGIFEERWLLSHLDALESAAGAAVLEGDALLHGDVRSDNICFIDGRTLLVDWNWACRGSRVLDVAAWLPSLAHEGGPAPWTILPGQGEIASLLAGFFLEHAGREPIPQAPHVRQLQLDQGIVALGWACRELGLPPPH
jgi:Phosphotransferase enzyme family